MSAAQPSALRRNLLLFAMAFAVAATAFGTVMLTSPPTSEAAGASLTDDGVIPPVTNCEFLPIADVSRCTVYR